MNLQGSPSRRSSKWREELALPKSRFERTDDVAAKDRMRNNISEPVYTENFIRVDEVTESAKLAQRSLRH
jgi:hypothetical protein